MARYDHLPTWRDANRLLVLVEDAVRHFPRDLAEEGYLKHGFKRRVLRLVWRSDFTNTPAFRGLKMGQKT